MYELVPTGLFQQFSPDLIKGDLDSLRDDVRQHYVAKARARLDFTVCTRYLYDIRPSGCASDKGLERVHD